MHSNDHAHCSRAMLYLSLLCGTESLKMAKSISHAQAKIFKNGWFRRALNVFGANNITKAELHRSNEAKLITHDIQMSRWRGIYSPTESCDHMDSCWPKKDRQTERDTGKNGRERDRNSSDGRKDTSKDMRLADTNPKITNEVDLRHRRLGSWKQVMRASLALIKQTP